MTSLRQCVRDVSPYLVVLIAITTLGPLQFGYHLAELNAPQDVITCEKKSIDIHPRFFPFSRTGPSTTSTLPECIRMSAASFATISSIFTVGGLAGALAAGPLSSTRGRLLSMRLTAVLFLLGSATEALAWNIPIMALGRLLAGFGAGAATVIVPLYISEVAPPAERGFFGAWTQISINVGILATQTLGYFLSYGSMWRWVMGAGVLVAAVQGLGLLGVPESPVWIAATKGDTVTARRVLQRLRGRGVSVEEEVAAWGPAGGVAPTAEEEGLLAQDGVGAGALLSPTALPAAKPPTVHLGFLHVVRDSHYRPAIIAVVGIMFAQQLCGINSIVMYSVSLLADLLPTSSALLTIVISAINLLTTIACAPLPDRLGRKTCILISIIGQGSSSLALALSIAFGVKILSAVAVLFFVAFFAVGLGPVPFILASELVGQEAVGATQSWALAANYGATFLVAQFFPIVNEALNGWLGGAGWVYFIFAAFAAIFTLFVWRNVPETRGKRDADEVWGRVRRLD